MSFLNLGERKTAAEWRLEEEGLMSFFRDDETLISRDEWLNGEHRHHTNSAPPPKNSENSE